jgi:hypothetical protein
VMFSSADSQCFMIRWEADLQTNGGD